jgi:hypothetical protein
LNGDCRVEIQIPDAEGFAKEGCSEAVPRENCDHKAKIMVPEHFSSLVGLVRGWIAKEDRSATDHKVIGNARMTDVVSNRRDVQAK